MAPILTNDWAPLLEEEFHKPYYLQLREFLQDEYAAHQVYPPMHDIFNALHFTGYAATKVVILGQDPYHGPGQAHGLSFSVKPGVKTPPSLRNMYKELQSDLGCTIPNNGYLVKWAEQGVLLLNTVMTVRESEPNSHKGKGWETFTDRVIQLLNERDEPVIFVLWGSHAQKKKAIITNPRHHIIEAPHPSPLSASRGFFGSRPFSQINAYLRTAGKQEIDWQIPDL
ncbi:uracil-DNA glycosylase [Ectobacillus ponti]|uniref:Uracil-DNA glycosylase n=1 Tax=Ectobacillus ponti TaxID=2961894 RepID=A0AA42BQ34_9BACI|nr:uracil-DNA glycosylase [Ectobacillus ponti]MCP8968019.1 uracil-DNA glycosylase [Ectobacillus ponti]